MPPSADELFEAALDLPHSLRKDLAPRLLQSVEVVDESVDEKWADEIASRSTTSAAARSRRSPAKMSLPGWLPAWRTGGLAARRETAQWTPGRVTVGCPDWTGILAPHPRGRAEER